MIVRNVEYTIYCDNPECPDGSRRAHAFNDLTREDCAQSAIKHGWLRCTRKQWLCPRCAEQARKAVWNRQEDTA